MSKAPILILLLAVAALAVAFLTWSGGNADVSGPDEPVTIADEAQPPSAVLEVENGPTAEVPLAGDADAGALPDGLLRSEVVVTETSRPLIVQVWDHKIGVPAANAAVFVLDGFDGEEPGDPFAPHWSDLAEANGLRFATDAQGRVELPPVRSQVIVTATRPGAYAFTRVGQKHRDVETLTLQPDETLTVRVTDAADRVVIGVPVGVLQRILRREDPEQWWARLMEIEGRMARVEAYARANPGQPEVVEQRVQGLRAEQARLTAVLTEAKRGGAKAGANKKSPPGEEGRLNEQVSTRLDLRAQRRTDKEGLAVFRHFQLYRQQPEKWWPRGDADQFEAVLLLPSSRPETRAFAGRPVPSDTIELRLPPSGSVALRTVDRDGRPFLHPVHAELRGAEGENAPWARMRARKAQDEAAIIFPFVGLGLGLTAACRLDDEDFRWEAPPFAGPQNAGECVTIDLVVAPGEGMLCGRVFDAEGRPLAGVRPTFLINSHAGRLEGEEVVLDQAGRFHLPYQVRPQHQGPFRIEIRRDDLRPTAGFALSLAALPAGTVTDLGDLRLDALGRLAFGTAVDDRGLPIPGATVQLQREREVRGKEPRREFIDEAFTATRADAEGHFELFGEIEAGRYRLRAQANEHFPFESDDLRRGETITLRLQRRSRVVGTVLTPEWLASRNVRVRLESALDPQQRREDQVRDHEGRKYLYFDWVRPGLYTVLLSVPGFPDPFVRIDALEILPGQTDLHPRLSNLELALHLHRFEVIAVDQNGERLPMDRPLLARIQRADGRLGFVGFPWKEGVAEIIAATRQLEVLPWASGYRAEPTVLTPGRSEIRFLAIPPVDLLVTGLRQSVEALEVQVLMEQLPGAGMPDQLEAWDGGSNRISGWYQKARYAAAPLGANDLARFTLPGDGRYRVTARLGAGLPVKPVAVDLGEVEVRLVPGSGPQRVTVTFDPARVRDAVATLAQRRAANPSQGPRSGR